MEEKEVQGAPVHKRRVRYSGTHPRRFEEKYKEQNPEKYADTIEKVIKKGSTPAGMHISICVKEILDFLDIKPGMQGLDVTLGYGGHTTEMLKKLEGQGHMYALDVDPIEIVKTKERLKERGFGEEILTIKQMDMEEIAGMFAENSDEPYAEEIAREIAKRNRKRQYIETTTELKEVIEQVLSFIPEKERKEAVKKSCQRCFQALRIDVNQEFEVLESFLSKLPGILAPGGRAAILTFHSGEDRLVKYYFKDGKKEEIYSDVASDVIRPSAEECQRNPRARSTKMRWAIRDGENPHRM